jgi:hypothetical protein
MTRPHVWLVNIDCQACFMAWEYLLPLQAGGAWHQCWSETSIQSGASPAASSRSCSLCVGSQLPLTLQVTGLRCHTLPPCLRCRMHSYRVAPHYRLLSILCA